MPQNDRLMIDGKIVRKYLFARMSKFSPHPVLAQVEAFNVDHALNRLQNDIFPGIPSAEWNLIDELDAEHEVGALGSSHPLNPIILPQHRRIQ